MSQHQLNEHEMKAAHMAIDVAGPYLDEIGITDLGALSEEQMDRFLELFIRAYEDAMKEMPF